MDKTIIKRRFEAAMSSYDRQAGVQRDVCRRLADELAALNPHVERAVEIGVGTGMLTRHLTALFPQARWWLNDLTARACERMPPCCTFLAGDAEALQLPDGLDLVASASTVQWFDDLPYFLRRCAAATRSGGLLALSTFGPENFREVRAAAGRGLSYHSASELAELAAEAGYNVLTLKEYVVSLTFGTPVDVLRHIKATGVGGAGSSNWTKGSLQEFDARYRAINRENITLAYHPVIIVARRR
ncbi:MAG: malonyl-ACP O-methyltransferase [Rikenellaceae bacterium]|nr:malonyl-ACP O-methyltransferase [Rikenellaceae bacterium]